MTQDEWLFKMAGIAQKTRKVPKYSAPYYREETIKENIKDLTYQERKLITEMMKNYWDEHKPSSLEFLVNDAIVKCSKGTRYSRVQGKDHGVYTDIIGGQALLNEDDIDLLKIDGTIFGICAHTQKKCMAKKIAQWYGVNEKTQIGEGKASLTMNSFMLCPHFRNIHIRPITSGQEFTFSNSLFRYPKFIVEDKSEVPYFNEEYWNSYSFYNVEIDMTVIKKLAIRNMIFLVPAVSSKESKGYYEIKWIEYLAKYLLLCDDKTTICNILNVFFDKPGFNDFTIVGAYDLLMNYEFLMISAEYILRDVLIKQSSAEQLQSIGMWTSRERNINIIIENYFLLLMMGGLYVFTHESNKTKPAIDSITSIGSIEGGIKKHYGNGTVINYETLYENTKSVLMSIPISTYISSAINGELSSDLLEIWNYFNDNKPTSFVTMFGINLLVTLGLAQIPPTMATLALTLSIAWTVGGSFLGLYVDTKLQEIFDEESHIQSLGHLTELLKVLDVYLIFANTGEEYKSFIYKIFPGSDTARRVNIFMDNISKLYVERDNGKDVSLQRIFKLRNKEDKSLDEKINALIAALTLETMTNERVFGKKSYNESASAVKTGIEILKTLDNLTIKVNKDEKPEEHDVKLKIGEEEILLKDTTCMVKNGTKDELVGLEYFFTETIQKKN
jgi:hypothetical protein